MPCRVGISTNPAERMTYWDNRVVGLNKWRILKVFLTQQEAQDYETKYAAQYGCRSAPGGPHTPGQWSVYRFDYTRDTG